MQTQVQKTCMEEANLLEEETPASGVGWIKPLVFLPWGFTVLPSERLIADNGNP